MSTWLQRYRFFLSDGRRIEWTAFRKAWQTRGYRRVLDVPSNREELLGLAGLIKTWGPINAARRMLDRDVADAVRCGCRGCVAYLNDLAARRSGDLTLWWCGSDYGETIAKSALGTTPE